MAQNEKLSGLHLKTAQDVLDYFNTVGGYTKELVTSDEKDWIEPILARYDEDEIKYVLEEGKDINKMVVFDMGYFETVLKGKKANEELAKLAPKGNTTADYAISVMGELLVKSFKETQKANLMDWFKEEVISQYGVIRQPVQYISVKGEPIKGTVNKTAFDRVLKWIQLGEPVMVSGPAGTGKNVLATQVAEATGFTYMGINAVKNVYELTGFNNINGYQDTTFYKACKVASEGTDVLLFLDEFDAWESDVSPTFNDAIQAGEFTFPNNENLNFKEHMHFLAAANTWGTGATSEYVGRNQLDAATLNRFTVVYVDYMPEIEDALCDDQELLQFLREFREGVFKCGIQHIVSYRNIRQAAAHFKTFGKTDIKETLQECLIKNLTNEDLGQITKYLTTISPYRKVILDMAEY